MNPFSLKEAIQVLERTPLVLQQLLTGLSVHWLNNNEGPETWSPFDIVGHLIHGEKTDWIPRARLILQGQTEPFDPFDRFAQFEHSKGKSIEQLLSEFEKLRNENVKILLAMHLTEVDFKRVGLHPDFGDVTLQQLLSTWVVHDLSHIRQIARVMAKRYTSEIGPWAAYLPVVQE